MKKVLVIILLVSGLMGTACCQKTSRDNYTGDWENDASWTTSPGPGPTVEGVEMNLNVYGYITRTGNLSVAGSTSTKDFIVNDTLVILGDFNFGTNSAELIIGPDAVLIVIGSMTLGSNAKITNNGIFVVSEDMTFPTGDSDIYTGSGELFTQGSITNNSDASAANIWSELDDRYPVIYDFVMCGGTSPCALPVKLSYFNATVKKQLVILKWATVMEEDFRNFVIQRSSSGTFFEDIAELPGKGFNIYDIETRYEFVDEMPLVGLNYYRLKAVDLDDSYEYFQVKTARVEGVKTLAVYPNPSSGESISFNFNFDPQENDRVVLVDHVGYEVFSASATSAYNKVVFDSRLRPGIYILRFVSKEFEQTSKVIIRD